LTEIFLEADQVTTSWQSWLHWKQLSTGDIPFGHWSNSQLRGNHALQNASRPGSQHSVGIDQ